MKCKTVKPLKEYTRDKARKDGRHSYCKQCRSLEGKARYRRSSKTDRYLKDAYTRYGITPKEYFELLNSQHGRCMICGGTDSRNMAVDHDHSTGHIRALLCSRCNVAVAMVKDSGWIAARIAEYLIHPESFRPAVEVLREILEEGQRDG